MFHFDLKRGGRHILLRNRHGFGIFGHPGGGRQDGLILGIIWAAWHIPAFFISGLQYESWSAVPYFGGVIALSVIMTPIFNSARGSLLIAYLYHFQMMNPIFPDAQPWDSLFVAIAAVIIVVLNRRTMFQIGAGVTEVLMPEETPVAEN